MSATTALNDSPISAPIQPLHNPSQAAHVVVPQAPLGNFANQAPGMGVKALLAKRMVDKKDNHSYTSPTDNLMTPCTQKLSAARKKQFTKGAKPIQLFAQREGDEEQSDASAKTMDEDDENPF